jgi:chromate transporter
VSLPQDLLDLAALFVRTSFAAFGGGLTVLPEIERVVVTQHHWLTAQEFANSYALGQFTPGPGMLMVMAIGYKVAGVPGAVASALAMFLPVGIVAYVAGANWDRLQRWRWRSSVQRGIAPVTVGLLLAGSYTLTRAAITDVASAAIMAAAALLLLSRRINPALIVLLGGAAGWILFR